MTKKRLMLSNKYQVYAALYPAILTAIPCLQFCQYTLLPALNESITGIHWAFEAAIKIVVCQAPLFLAIQVNRLLGKLLQGYFFKHNCRMPATRYLLWSNKDLPAPIKKKILDKAEAKFGIALQGQLAEDQDETEACNVSRWVVSLIEKSLISNSDVLRHAMIFKFFRHLAGGSVHATLFTAINIYNGQLQGYAAVFITSSYVIPLVTSKFLFYWCSKEYTAVLYQQFLIGKDEPTST